jgi:hypothetical protein
MAVPAAVLSGQIVGVLPSTRSARRVGPGGRRGRIAAGNAATGIPSLRAATVLTRPARLARRLLRR